MTDERVVEASWLINRPFHLQTRDKYFGTSHSLPSPLPGYDGFNFLLRYLNHCHSIGVKRTYIYLGSTRKIYIRRSKLIVYSTHASHVLILCAHLLACPTIPFRSLVRYLKMGDKRCANNTYAEDVDDMILEYLIYSATKACIDDFAVRNVGENTFQASHSVLTQLHILNGKTDCT